MSNVMDAIIRGSFFISKSGAYIICKNNAKTMQKQCKNNAKTMLKQCKNNAKTMLKQC
jgi:hypothetical protein